jgi:hypothetical protein
MAVGNSQLAVFNFLTAYRKLQTIFTLVVTVFRHHEGVGFWRFFSIKNCK